MAEGEDSQNSIVQKFPQNGEWQISQANSAVTPIQNFPRDLLNVVANKQCIPILKNCKNVHIGPKIENHYHQSPKSSEASEELWQKYIFEKCVEKLKDKYRTNYAYMRSFLWEGKRNDLPIEHHFVEVVIEKATLFGKNTGDSVEIPEIFQIEDSGHQTVLMSGGPGYGKTTLCKKIAYDWATNELSQSYTEHFDLVIIVILRELRHKSLKDTIMANLFHNPRDEDISKLQEANLNILIILDGFDEILDKTSVIRFIRHDSFDISLRMTIFLTSRPQATEHIREDMKQRFSIEGFSREQQRKYMEIIFREDVGKINDMIRRLDENQFLSERAACPLMLHMLCCIHQNDDIKKLERLTDLYIRVFSLITERYVRKNEQKDIFKRGKYFVGEDLLLKLSTLTFPITSEKLEKHFPTKEEYSFIVGLDVIVFYSFSQYDDHVSYELIHRSFKEFLVGFYMYMNLDYRSDVNETTILFLLGFFREETIPKQLLTKFFNATFRPNFMLYAHKEIKLMNNWKLFCSVLRVKFSEYTLTEMEKLLNLYQFQRIYLCFPGKYEDYRANRDKLLKFFNSIKLPVNAEVHIFLRYECKSWELFYDIRKCVSCIIDLFLHLGPVRHKIYFNGVIPYGDVSTFRNRKDLVMISSECALVHPQFTKLFQFNFIDYAVVVPTEVSEEFNIDIKVNYIALQIVVAENKTCFSFLISVEQYKILKYLLRNIFPFGKYECSIL